MACLCWREFASKQATVLKTRAIPKLGAFYLLHGIIGVPEGVFAALEKRRTLELEGGLRKAVPEHRDRGTGSRQRKEQIHCQGPSRGYSALSR